jgi:RNA polymerase sigma-70 factor (ECF subfamily)
VEAPATAVTEEAFEALVDRWYGSTVRVARLLGPDDATARRATYDAWLAVIDRLPEFDGDEPLHLVVLRATIESLAARVAAGDAIPAYDQECFEVEGHRWAGWWRDESAPQEWTRRPADEALTRALSELDAAIAVVVTLRDVEEVPADEVERVLELTPADQRVLLHRGRAAVWKALG